jgi:hypothetical protein
MPSTAIAGYEYDAVTETLTIQFVSGKVYNYQQVPQKVYKEMRATISKGIFLNRHIKGKYPFIEVKP